MTPKHYEYILEYLTLDKSKTSLTSGTLSYQKRESYRSHQCIAVPFQSRVSLKMFALLDYLF